MAILERRAAEAGEKFELYSDTFVVQPRPDGSNPHGGYWVCTSCGEAFSNNMQKDSHCTKARKRGTQRAPGGTLGSGPRAKHVLAWYNYDTGNYEVP